MCADRDFMMLWSKRLDCLQGVALDGCAVTHGAISAIPLEGLFPIAYTLLFLFDKPDVIAAFRIVHSVDIMP